MNKEGLRDFQLEALRALALKQFGPTIIRRELSFRQAEALINPHLLVSTSPSTDEEPNKGDTDSQHGEGRHDTDNQATE